MNIIIVHGYGHRMNEFNLVESAPVVPLPDGIALEDSGWRQRTPESMDMTGGDFELVMQQLEIIKHVFRSEVRDRVGGPNSTVQQSEETVKVKAF